MNTLAVMSPILLVALGGAIGSVLRHLTIQQVIVRLYAAPFPFGTMLVNVIGSFLIGVIMMKFASQTSHETAKLFLVTGILGGFTTFSAFSWDALQLLQRGQVAQAIGYIGGSVVVSLMAVALGALLVR